MIPIHLSLTGFLSYRDPVELDFSSFDLACISGPNGAGKSSLLDAITWALFGQARKRDDALINAGSSVAKIEFTFAYENNIYRVLRIKPRDKTSLLEFHILQDGVGVGADRDLPLGDLKTWKPLTERTLRETDFRILQTLRLDYETFVNASFFLQGKADQFAQQPPSDRKRILGNILGLEIWETYRQRALERRRAVEVEIYAIDGSLREINAELGEEEARTNRLAQLEGDLNRLSRERQAHEVALVNMRKVVATLAEQKKLVDALARQRDSARDILDGLNSRLAARQIERGAYTDLIGLSAEIEANYQAWQASRADLEIWEQVALRFREHEARRAEPREQIQAEQARLSQELLGLQNQAAQYAAAESEIARLRADMQVVGQALQQLEQTLTARAELDAALQTARQRQAEARAENPRLKADMYELNERIGRLAQVEGALCPLCGQPLGPQERQELIERLKIEGKEMGDRYRANQELLLQSDGQVSELERQVAALAQGEGERQAKTQALAQLSSQAELLERQAAAWQSAGATRLQEVGRILEEGEYAPEARQRLAEIDAELKAIGYDATAHDRARQAELSGRASEAGLRDLEIARAALAPLERESADLQERIASQNHELARLEQETGQASADLAAALAEAPDLEAAEATLLDLAEQENHLRMEVGAARQRVLVLSDLKTRRRSMEAQREQAGVQVGQYKQLERAFGKDGVPALLVEQALPEIESKANDLLDRLSGGEMSVRFITQSAYKDKRREDLKETLDIQISDSAGARDYEMFSGGEAFRVNFAIRLALSEVLAQRAGARLQTLVIDEGFGSQDALGRQRLAEAINLVRFDFAKILVITHIDELKDRFPTRIEVEKTERGSTLRVM